MFLLMEAPLVSFNLGTSPPLTSAHVGKCHACHANTEMEKATKRSSRELGVGGWLYGVQQGWLCNIKVACMQGMGRKEAHGKWVGNE